MSDFDVLVIDDSEVIRSIMVDILVRQGAKVLTAENGIDALEKLTINRNIKMIFCDLHMPVCDGMQFISRLKNNIAHGAPFIPIVMLTTERTKEFVMKAKESGIVKMWIIKPVVEDSVIKAYKALTAKKMSA